MIRINEHYTKLKASYLFADIARRVVVLRDGVAEERVALLGAVAFERRALRHLVGGGVQRLNAHGRERFGDVADAEADDG